MVTPSLGWDAITVAGRTNSFIAFTNGLRAYLSGDTGLRSEMKTVVHDLHRANLALMNLGPNAVSPQAAAYVGSSLPVTD